MNVLSHFGHDRLFATLLTIAKFLCPWDSSGKNTGMIFPPPGDLPLLEIKSASPSES